MQDASQEIPVMVTVTLDLAAVNLILNALGEKPAKDVYGLITFLRERAQAALQAAVSSAPGDSQPNAQPEGLPQAA